MKRHHALFVVAAILLSGLYANAANPLRFTAQGKPYVWKKFPITLSYDSGKLGYMSNEEAIAFAREGVDVWPKLSTVSGLAFADAQLGRDVTGDNWMDFMDALPREVNPVIFDDDGSIHEIVFGEGGSNNYRGFAGFLRSNAGSGEILQGRAVLNGLKVADEEERAGMRVTMIHEMGHFLGLIHAQHNQGDFDAPQPLMFPTARAKDRRLRYDDESGMSLLYPSESFTAGSATIRGRILFPDGKVPFEGANVVARDVDKPEIVVSSVSGIRFTPYDNPQYGSNDPALKGVYEIGGLPPGAYTIEVEEIFQDFTKASRVGVMQGALQLPGVPEFYNEGESSSDDPGAKTIVRVNAGETRNNIDIILNGGDQPDFWLTIDADTKTIAAGETAEFTIVPMLIGGFKADLALEPILAAAGSEVIITPKVEAGDTLKVVVPTSADTAPGTYLLLVVGTTKDERQVRTVAATLKVGGG